MKENAKNYFGLILERERKRENRSLRDLAEMLGKDENGKYNITPSYLNRLEKGEKENPSFSMVCLMIEKLGLNPLEVLKSFGFENILNYNYKEKSNYIQDIVRTSDMMGTLDKSESKYGLLNQNEKEDLLKIIENVLLYGICDEYEISDHLINLIMHLDSFRICRLEHFEKIIHINDKEISLRFSENIKNQMENVGISDEDICEAISELGEKLLIKKDRFMVKDNMIGINAELNKVNENTIIIEHIFNCVEDIEINCKNQ